MTRGYGVTLLAVATFFGTPTAGAETAPAQTWASMTASPLPADEEVLGAFERDALARCGKGELGLEEVARQILKVEQAGGKLPDAQAIAFAQRFFGEPHSWASAWSSRSTSGDALLEQLQGWLGRASHLRRCGVASGPSVSGARILVVVHVEALADLAGLPLRARVGQWLTVEARLHVPVRGAQVVVLGPTGPRALLTSLEGSILRAHFAPDQPGEFAVQVLADLESGPRPVLDATVFADVEPTQAPPTERAPGEELAATVSDETDALGSMLAAARRQSHSPALERDGGLDVIARSHALAMSRSGLLAHDAGDGLPDHRLAVAGRHARVVAENAAHAPTIAEAHRALWLSPSHRLNMILPEVRRVGIGVVHDANGEVWVTQIFEGY